MTWRERGIARQKAQYHAMKAAAAEGDPVAVAWLSAKRASGKATSAKKRASVAAARASGDPSVVAAAKAFNDRKNELERERRRANPEKHRQDVRAWQANNRAYVNANIEDWRKRNNEATRSYLARRRARAAAASGSYTGKEIKNLLDQQKFRCVYCRSNLRSKYHIDHIMPLALGGGNDIKNIQLLCAPCNLRKHAKHPVSFAQEVGLLL